jgi:hypothetical protein
VTRLRVALLTLAVSLAGLMGFTACGGSPSAAPAAQAQPADDDGYDAWVASDDEDVPDCDAEDRRKQETPDCGFRSGGKFYWWSWASRGSSTAPYGWHPGAEQRAVTAQKAPATRVTTPPSATTAAPPAAPRTPTRSTKRVVTRSTPKRR